MKKLITLLTCVSVCSMSYGKSVDVNTAKNIGYNFLAPKGVVKSAADMQLAYTATTTTNGVTNNDFYVFNVTSAKGFVMVAADDKVLPILAFSKRASFGTENMPANIAGWLKGYQNQIEYVIGHNTPASQTTANQWTMLAKSNNNMSTAKVTDVVVGPLLQTTWDQEPFYNADCPYDNNVNERTVTGCVATATAQVMRYWNWPATGSGLHSYTDPTYGAQSAIYDTTTYRWDQMPLSISAPNAEIAKLMYHVGVAVDMTYGTAQADGSGAFVLEEESPTLNCSEYALKTYFHYKQSLHGVERFTYYNDEAGWINLIESEINAGRPVLYEGFGNLGGHNWVADGYDNETIGIDYIDFNWGWSGVSDGFYSVDTLAPTILGAGGGDGNFDQGQAILVGVAPDSSILTPAGNIQMGAFLTTTAPAPTGFGQAFSFTTRIINSDTTTFNGDFSAQILDTTGNVMDSIQTIANDTLAAGDTSASLTFSTSGLYTLLPSVYVVRVYYRPTGGSWSLVANNGSYINNATLLVANDTDLALYDSMQVTQNNVISDTVHAGQPISVAVQIGNDNYYNYQGSIGMALYNINDGSLVFNIQTLPNRNINAYGYLSFSFSNNNLDVAPGKYLMMVKHTYTGDTTQFITSSIYYPNPMILTVDSATNTAISQVKQDNTIAVYPNPANDVVYVDVHNLRSAVSAIRVMDMQGREMQVINNPANNNIISIPVNTLAAGLYFVEVQTATGITTQKISIVR